MSDKPTRASEIAPVAPPAQAKTVEEIVKERIAKERIQARVRTKAIRAVDEEINGPTYSSPDLFERLSRRSKGTLQ